jgi:hypothetical protein
VVTVGEKKTVDKSLTCYRVTSCGWDKGFDKLLIDTPKQAIEGGVKRKGVDKEGDRRRE